MSFQNKQPVTWLKQVQTASGFNLAISEKSGIVKIQFPESFHNIMIYKDQVHTLGLTQPEIREYFAANDNMIRNSGENKATRKLNKEKQKLVDGIANNPALTAEQKEAMLKLLVA